MKAKRLWGLGLACFLATAPAAAIENRLGVGVHLWKSAGDLWAHPAGADEHDLTALLSYQLVLLRRLKLQLDVEYFPNGFGGAGVVALFPQGLVVVGDRWYVAAGAGWVYSNRQVEGNLSDVIYIARLGVDLPVRARLHFDLCAQQRAADVSGLAEVGEDTVTFAAVLRLRL
jgi:hypothetical protein